MEEINAKRTDVVTDEMWRMVNKFNRDMVSDYLDNQTHLSPQSRVAYSSALKIYFWWVYENLDNKDCTQIKKKEFIKFINWMTNRGMSESAIRFKKSSVSAFNKYIESFYEDEYPMFRNYVTTEMRVVSTGKVHNKVPLTEDEITKLCDELEAREEWQKLAYVKFTYSTGCRRAESIQLLKEVVNYSPTVKTITVYDEDGKEQVAESVYYKTHEIRCKGRSKVGKVRRLQFGPDVMEALNKWLEVRGEDDCPYMFVYKDNKTTKQICGATLNLWCQTMFTEIVGRRVHPHLFRSSRATNLVVSQHKNIEVAQKLLGHESSETTKVYVVREGEDDADEAFI